MKITWRCPQCMKRNKWEWEDESLNTRSSKEWAGKLTMHCDHCKRKTEMYQDRASNFAAIDNIEDLLNFSDAKNFLESNGFIVKNAVTFTNNG